MTSVSILIVRRLLARTANLILNSLNAIVLLGHTDEVTDEEAYCVGEEPENQSVEEHKSVILHLLSQLKLGMDLTKVPSGALLQCHFLLRAITKQYFGDMLT